MRPRVAVQMLGTLGAGGAERQLLTFIDGMDRARWEPVVIAMTGGLLEDEFRSTVETHVLGKRRKVEVGLPFRIRAILNRLHPDVVHTYMFTANTWGRLAVMLWPHNRPIVVGFEGNIETWKGPFHNAADRVLLGVTDAMIGNSHAVSRYLIEHDHVPASKVHTIQNGIDLRRAQRYLRCPAEERERLRRALGLMPTDFVIGHVARPSSVKGLALLLDVIERFHREEPSARLLRVGPPPLAIEEEAAAAFDRGVRERGLADVVIAHPFTPDISAALVVMDALVQTSWQEGLPNAVMEAMSMEVPVVATSAGGTSELVHHGETGWLVATGDLDGLIDGLRTVRAHPDVAWAWLGPARRLIETEYSVQALVGRTVELYEQLLRRRS